MLLPSINFLWTLVFQKYNELNIEIKFIQFLIAIKPQEYLGNFEIIVKPMIFIYQTDIYEKNSQIIIFNVINWKDFGLLLQSWVSHKFNKFIQKWFWDKVNKIFSKENISHLC